MDVLKIGSRLRVYGHWCTVYRLRPLGTADVVSDDRRHYWRVTGYAVHA